MKNIFPSAQNSLAALMAAYWIPLVMLCIYASPRKSWLIMIVGLLLSTLGGIFYWILMRRREESVEELKKQPLVINPPTAVDEDKIRSLEEELQKCENTLREKDLQINEKQHFLSNSLEESERHKALSESLKQEIDTLKSCLNEQREHFKGALEERQQTIAELRDALQAKQQVASQLESKVRDLSYEIKTILQIAEGPREKQSEFIAEPVHKEEHSPHVHSFEEALMLLKRSLDSAQRIAGSSHFAKSHRFKDLPAENYALDLRRLFDHFQSEAEGALFVYSPQENKMLFGTDQIEPLLEVNPERFVKSFYDLIEEHSKEEWNRAISQLSFRNETKLSLSFKSKPAHEIMATCVLGMIPTGLFRNHVIGVLFPTPTCKPSPATF